MRVHRIAADGIGVSVLGGLAGLVAWIVGTLYSKEDAIWAWSIGFPLLALCGLFAWHNDKWITSFAIDALISTSMYPEFPFRYAIWHAGSPFGIVLTMCICPGFTLVALAGAVRAFLLTSNTDSTT